MTVSAQHKRESRIRRHRRVRKKVLGTADRPRLAVFRSNKHITAQVIDDRTGRTLAAASTTENDLKAGATGNKAAASQVGKLVAERAKAAGVDKVVFDRGGYVYHGRIAAVADDHEGGEAEATTALHHLGDAVDVDDARLAQRRIAGRAGVLARLALALPAGGT